MRRWNGWGDDTVDSPLTEPARQFLAATLGPAKPARDAELADVLTQVPNSKLKDSNLWSSGAETRLLHSRGQSFPDWVQLRSGTVDSFPDAVATPISQDEVRALLDAAKAAGAAVIPWGGGTSVVGHLTPEAGGKPVLSIDLSRMNRLQHIEPDSRLATFGAGVTGAHLEAQLRAQGYVLGHFPQSFEYSTLGGWVVTRSSGQQSLRYGRIEQLFAGGHLELPDGRWDIPCIPATGAGTDVRELVLGSEGRLGILTDATVRISPMPERDDFHAIFFPDWDSGVDAVRSMAQAGLALSMLRLSNAIETATQLKLAGDDSGVKNLERYLRLRSVGEGMCMLIMGVTGPRKRLKTVRGEALRIARQYKGVHIGRGIGRTWAQKRFKGPYFRNSLWDAGYSVDTAETCVNWPNVKPMMAALEQAGHDALAEHGEKVHAFTHLSHVYAQGSSVYSTFIFRSGDTPEETIARWKTFKQYAGDAIAKYGGTISHQHGVGVDHQPWLAAEKGAAGVDAIRGLMQHVDPNGLMNPGKLVTP